MPQKHYKKVLYDSIGSNKNLKRIIDDALKSPAGSSHRKYAKTILRTISKSAAKKFDGQGGSGSMISSSQQSDPWAKYNLPSPTQRFHPLPPCPKKGTNPNYSREQRLAASVQGQETSMAGETKKQDGKGGATGIIPTVAKYGQAFGDLAQKPLDWLTSPKAGAAMVGAANVGVALPFMVEGAGEYALGKTAQAFYKPEGAPDVKFDQTTGGSIASNIISPKTNPIMGAVVDTFNSPTAKKTTNPYAGTDMDRKLNEAWQRIQKGIASQQDKDNVQYATTKGWSTSAVNPDVKTSQTANPNFQQSIIGDGSGLTETTKTQGQTNAPVVSKDGKTYTYTNRDGSVHRGQIGDNYVDNTQASSSSSETFKTSTSETSSTPDSTDTDFDTGEYWVGQTIHNTFQDAAAQGFTGDAALQYALQQPGVVEEIQKMFPNIDPKYFIGNKNVVEAIKDINTAIKSEMGLDDILKDLNSVKSQQYGIKDTMINYIKGRDEYYTKIEKMMQDATDKYLSRSDADNPTVQQQYKQYMEYLTGLKGRQYTRYANALNQSITSFDNKYKQLQDSYDTTLEQYNEKIKIEDAIATQDYEDVYNALQGVYQGAVSTIKDASDSGTTKSAYFANATDGTGLSFKDVEPGKEGDYRKGAADVDDLLQNNSSKVIPAGTDLWDKFQMYSANNNDINAFYGFVDKLQNSLTSELKNLPTESNETSEQQLSRIDNIIKSWKSGFDNYTAQGNESGQGATEVNAKVNKMIQEVLKAEGTVYQKITKGQGAQIKKALKLLETGFKDERRFVPAFMEKTNQFTPENRSDFISKSGLNSSLANFIFDRYVNAVTEHQSPTSSFSGYSAMTDSQVENLVARVIHEAESQKLGVFKDSEEE